MADCSELIKKATEIVQSSRLSKADKELLLGRLPYVSMMILQMFVEVCEEDPFSIDPLVVNLKKKIDASGNLHKIHALIEHEREEISESIRNKKLAQESLQAQAA